MKQENITAVYLILECKKKKSQWKKPIDLSKIIHIKRQKNWRNFIANKIIIK